MTWSLPLDLDSGGEFPRHRRDPFLDTVKLILGVAPGERRFLPEFGWGGHLLPDLQDPIQRQAAAVMAEDALRRWARDLAVERVEVLGVDGNRIELELLRGGLRSRLEIELRRWDAR